MAAPSPHSRAALVNSLPSESRICLAPVPLIFNVGVVVLFAFKKVTVTVIPFCNVQLESAGTIVAILFAVDAPVSHVANCPKTCDNVEKFCLA